ncbi:MAG: nucleoside kinase [Candidatus Atribacteria bacterium]|nr:MAG: nucleoside kinase [Candidatus Atribacteria bacterium]
MSPHNNESPNQTRSDVHAATLRPTVQVQFPDGRVFEFRRGSPLVDVFRTAYDRDNQPVAAIINDALVESSRPVNWDIAVKPVFLMDSDGARIYARSLSFLLVIVVRELYPEVRVYIDYSVPHGGYVCHLKGRDPFSNDELKKIKSRMKEIVAADLPILRKRVTMEEAREVFRKQGDSDKARLVASLDEDHYHLYELNGMADYFHGYMVSSTCVLKTFGLEPCEGGFVLRFPRREDPTRLVPNVRFKALRKVFDEYGEWLKIIGVRDVGSLNQAIRSERIDQIMLISEALHEKRIAEIAAILKRKHADGARLVFVAGPSSSGKTTFSKRLAIQLLASGLQPYPLGMDEYFNPRSVMVEKYGKDIDLDAPTAMDIALLQDHLHRIVRGEAVKLPHFNFLTGEREVGPTIQLAAGQILMVEGIHGLNPEILEGSPTDACVRIFVSALTQLNLDAHNRVSTTDTRLIRRIVRDAVFRGYPASDTLKLWDNVRRGEKNFIFPYQEEADFMFNSALSYELAVLKPFVESHLLQVKDPTVRMEADRLLSLLRWFEPLASDKIPSNSILREFIGGSTLRDFVVAPLNGKEHGSGQSQWHDDVKGDSTHS